MDQDHIDAIDTHGQSVPRSAFKAMVGGSVSLVVGLISQILIASIFGAGQEMDAFLTALVVPSFLVLTLTSGLTLILVPAFIDLEMKKREDDAWGLIGTFFWLLFVILLGLAILGAVLSEPTIRLLASGFSKEKSSLASQMFAILMFTLPLQGLGNISVGLQNARNQFFWPATATAVGSLGNIITILALHQNLGPISLAYGNLVSAGFAAFVTVLPLLRHGWKRLLPINHEQVIHIFRLILPFLIFGFITNSVTLFERSYASSLPDGELSFLGYAYKISSIVVVILAAGIASAIYPAMARAFSSKGENGLVDQSVYGLRLSMATALPVITLCLVAGISCVSLLYERGAFSNSDAVHVGHILAIVMFGDILCRMLANVISRTFYILKDTWTFMVISALGVIIYVLVGKLFVDNWGYIGLALAMALQLGLVVEVSFLFLARRLKQFPVRKLLFYGLIYTVCSAIGGLAAELPVRLLPSGLAFLQFPLAIILEVIVYLFLLFRFDKEICSSILIMFGVHRLFGSWGRRLKLSIQPPKE